MLQRLKHRLAQALAKGLRGELKTVHKRLEKIEERQALQQRSDKHAGQKLDALLRQDNLKGLRGDLKIVHKRLQRIEERQALQQMWDKHAGQKLNALLRQEYLSEFLGGEYPFEVVAKRFHLLAQNEEDGMVLALLQTAGVFNRTFVEIGCGTNGGNSGTLASEFGWRGLMVDRAADCADTCAERFGDGLRVQCKQIEVTPDNIDSIIAEHGLTGELDFFSLDIDSYDYWVLEAMTACSPRVMVVEYNARFGTELSVTIPRDAPLAEAPKGYHGASLAALSALAEAKGYRLLACDDSGTNAFYLRGDLRPEIAAVPVARAYRPMRTQKDPFGQELRKPLDVVGLAEQMGLPLHYI